MNRLLGLGLFSLVGTSFFACGEESSNSTPGGVAGSDSTDGSAGSAGSTNVTTVANTPAFVGIATCSGCVEVEVPVTGGNSEENLVDQVGFAFFPGQPLDLSNAVVTWRIMALENNPDLMVAPYAENGDPWPGAYRLQAALSEANFPPMTWVDVSFDLSAHPALGADAGVAVTIAPVDAGADVTSVVSDAGVLLSDAGLVSDAGVSDAGAWDAGVPVISDVADSGAPTPAGDPLAASFVQPLELDFDKSNVAQLALYVGSGPDLVGDAVAKIVIDSVTFTGVTDIPDVNFDAGLEGLTRNTFNAPPGTEGPVWH